MGIDLDDLNFEEDPVEAEVGSTPFESGEVPQGMSLESLMDRHQKMIFLIDISTSMSDTMSAGDINEVYDWPEGYVDRARKMLEGGFKAAYEVARLEVGKWGVFGFFQGKEGYDEEKTSVCVHWGIDVYDDLALMNLIVIGTLKTLGIDTPELKEKYANNHLTKLSTVKQAARSMISERYRRYPESTVTIMTFNTEAFVISEEKPLTATLAALENIKARGCTKIRLAVDMALKQFKKSPSEVKMHHLILVSDAEDASAKEVADMVPYMKKNGVVFDFILIRSANEIIHEVGRDEVVALIRICSETGGEFKEVRTVSDLNAMFLNAVNRKLLPQFIE